MKIVFIAISCFLTIFVVSCKEDTTFGVLTPPTESTWVLRCNFTNAKLNCLWMFNENKGLCAAVTSSGNGAPFNTNDGWDNMQQQSNIYGAEDIVFFDSTRGFIVGGGNSRTYLYLVSSSGEPAGFYDEIGFPLYGISNCLPMNGLPNQISNMFAVGYSNVLIGTNNGHTWTNINKPSSAIFHSAWMISDSIVLISSDSGVYKSTNLGESWSKKTTDRTFKVRFIDNNIGFALCTDGFYKSTDSGESWKKISNTTGSQWFFVLNNDFIVLQNNSFLRSKDGGITWNSKIIDNNYNLTSVYFINANTGFVTGYNPGLSFQSKIWKTTKGGID